MTDMQTTIKGVVYEQFGHPMAPMRTLKSFFKIDSEYLLQGAEKFGTLLL